MDKMDIDIEDSSRTRWNHVSKILTRPSPFSHQDFDPSPGNLTLVHGVRILVIGAGGLGCELLKNLALTGFRNVEVIDMDTIDISNLNRQFLFRLSDVGESKAKTAVAFINKRVQGANFVGHNCKIQDKDENFYLGFQLIVCGLDSIIARRWINGMVMSLVQYDMETGEPKTDTVIPIIDGGTEGFKGNARIIIPTTMTPCIDCTLDLYPPQINYPLCTIAQTPRLPEHCIEYVRLLLWPRENPFGEAPIDGDDPNHINWVFERAVERGNQFGITGISYRLTQGVVKNIIPAVASTNAIIAAACVTEVLKLVTSCATPLENYMVFSNLEGIYSYKFAAEKREDCLVCSRQTRVLEFSEDVTLQGVIDFLAEDQGFQMKSPGITGIVGDQMKTFYMQHISSTENNLKRKLKELGIDDEGEIAVADITTPNAITFKISYKKPRMEED